MPQLRPNAAKLIENRRYSLKTLKHELSAVEDIVGLIPFQKEPDGGQGGLLLQNFVVLIKYSRWVEGEMKTVGDFAHEIP